MINDYNYKLGGKDMFPSQVLLGWVDTFQGRFSIRWAPISTPENKKFQDFSKY